MSVQQGRIRKATWSIMLLSIALALVAFFDRLDAFLGVDLALSITFWLIVVVGLGSIALMTYVFCAKQSFPIITIVALIIGLGLAGTVGFMYYAAYRFIENCYDCFT